MRPARVAAFAACIASGLAGCAPAPPAPSLSRYAAERTPFTATFWPAQGPVIRRFDGQRNRGIDIAGEEGAPVLAITQGRVVYAGSTLAGYGKMVIIKHDDTFVTAYAHNRRLLVQEREVVLAGQQIAEMGSSDAPATMLHFEIRRYGKAVDPETYLVRSAGARSTAAPPSARPRPYTGRVDMDELEGLLPAQ